MLRKAIVLISLFLLPFKLLGAKSHTQNKGINLLLGIQQSQASVTTLSSSSSSAINSSLYITAFEPFVDYFLFKQFTITIGYILSLNIQNKISVKGADIGSKFYWYNDGHKLDAHVGNNIIKANPVFSSFVYAGYCQRKFEFTSASVDFTGLKIGAGADYHINTKYFVSGQGFYSKLGNSNIRKLTGFGAIALLGTSW